MWKSSFLTYQSRGGSIKMPSNIPSYVYSLFAALIVGVIVVSACSLSMANLRNKAEIQQLTNIDKFVAAQSLTLISQTSGANQNSTQFVDIPSQVGNQIYWVCIGNDSSGGWVESGFGTTVNLSQPQVRIPADVAASGSFVSGYGRAFLQCSCVNQTVTLMLTSE